MDNKEPTNRSKQGNDCPGARLQYKKTYHVLSGLPISLWTTIVWALWWREASGLRWTARIAGWTGK